MLRLSDSGRRFPNSKIVFSFISSAVNKNCSIDEAVQQSQPHLIEFIEDFYRILDHYTEFKSKHNLLDYDDLLIHLFRMLIESPEARLEISSRFRHVLVDEYQDTNWLQSMLVKLLSSVHSNVMAVGDNAQSIYSFWGADHRNIMRFTNAALANAHEKFDKQLFTVQPGGKLPVLHADRLELELATAGLPFEKWGGSG